VKIADKEHPITKGMSDFDIHDETYGNYYTSKDVHVLMTTDNPKNDPELAWVKEYGHSRVFFLMLGHDAAAWKNAAYGEILARGIRWTAGR
jgi:type 1 glutamine amidotransferase